MSDNLNYCDSCGYRHWGDPADCAKCLECGHSRGEHERSKCQTSVGMLYCGCQGLRLKEK